MQISMYDAQGNVISTKGVVKITNFAEDHGFGRTDYFTLHLEGGTYVDQPEDILDERYPGWRGLLETPGKERDYAIQDSQILAQD